MHPWVYKIWVLNALEVSCFSQRWGPSSAISLGTSPVWELSFFGLSQIIQVCSKSGTIPLGSQTGIMRLNSNFPQSVDRIEQWPFKFLQASTGLKITSTYVSYTYIHCPKPFFPPKWLLGLEASLYWWYTRSLQSRDDTHSELASSPNYLSWTRCLNPGLNRFPLRLFRVFQVELHLPGSFIFYTATSCFCKKQTFYYLVIF